jgi:hypothetical protein
MSGCECKRARSVSAIARNIKRSAQPEMKGIRPILKQLRTLAGFLFFCGFRFRSAGKKFSFGKNRNCRRIFKSSAEHSKQPPKIENCGWKPESSAERWAFRRKFETATRTIEKLRGKSTLSVKIGDVRGK